MWVGKQARTIVKKSRLDVDHVQGSRSAIQVLRQSVSQLNFAVPPPALTPPPARTSQSAGRSAAPGQHKVLRGHTPSQGRFCCPRSEYSIRGAMSISHLSNSLRMAQLSAGPARPAGTRAPSVVPSEVQRADTTHINHCYIFARRGWDITWYWL